MSARWTLVLVAMLLVRAPAAAQQRPAATPTLMTARDSAIEHDTRALASELRCPVCQGLSIQDSPSELSQQMRALVHDQLAAGKTPAQVRSYFVSKYGEWILLSPPAHGVNTLIYALPFLVLAAGGVIITIAVRRWTRASRDAPAV